MKRMLRKKKKWNIMLTNKKKQNHAAITLEIKLLLDNDKRTRLYLIMIQTLTVYGKKITQLLLEGRKSLFFTNVSQNMSDDRYSDYKEQKWNKRARIK